MAQSLMHSQVLANPAQGSPPQEPAFLVALAAAAASSSAFRRLAASSCALRGLKMRCTPSATLVPVSMGSSGSLRSLQQAHARLVSLWCHRV